MPTTGGTCVQFETGDAKLEISGSISSKWYKACQIYLNGHVAEVTNINFDTLLKFKMSLSWET